MSPQCGPDADAQMDDSLVQHLEATPLSTPKVSPLPQLYQQLMKWPLHNGDSAQLNAVQNPSSQQPSAHYDRTDATPRRCSNCGDDSTFWHRSKLCPGTLLCTKCNSFERKHQRARPLNTRRGPVPKQPREQAPLPGEASIFLQLHDFAADPDPDPAPRRCFNCGDASKRWNRSALRPGASVRATLSTFMCTS
ncbi:hypothetical protein B0H17DRAFT_1046056 [Mycena rosella]|uniref:GATA-type domain-containing protein n=1 Tax=Mycena rosella TaxID=1033263 RepID=A0AAD7DW37_MYCRO|nr:hypothetical protein B0H17DRAFT_1046056 [Mycena rosella]